MMAVTGGGSLGANSCPPKKEPQMTLLLIFVFCNRGCDFKSPVNGVYSNMKKKETLKPYSDFSLAANETKTAETRQYGISKTTNPVDRSESD